MKKKLLAVLMTGIMAMSFAATTTAVYAKGDDDNTLTVWAWDQNFNIKAMNIAGEQYAKDHEGFKVDVVETSSDDCQTKLTTAANAGDYSTLPVHTRRTMTLPGISLVLSRRICTSAQISPPTQKAWI